MFQNNDSYICVPVPSILAAELFKRSPAGINELVEHAVETYLERTQEDFEVRKNESGIFWEALFLPNGTQIRTKYFGEYKEASIKDDSIIWNQQKFPSFAQLVNAMRGDTSNNAWRELEIKRPSEIKWNSALSLRRK